MEMRLPCRFTNGTLGLRRLQLVPLARPFSVELCFSCAVVALSVSPFCHIFSLLSGSSGHVWLPVWAPWWYCSRAYSGWPGGLLRAFMVHWGRGRMPQMPFEFQRSRFRSMFFLGSKGIAIIPPIQGLHSLDIFVFVIQLQSLSDALATVVTQDSDDLFQTSRVFRRCNNRIVARDPGLNGVLGRQNLGSPAGLL